MSSCVLHVFYTFAPAKIKIVLDKCFDLNTNKEAMRTPPPIKKGDTIGIMSPAGQIDEQLVAMAVREIKNKGFECVTGQHTVKQKGIYAGSDDERLSDLQKMLDDPSVKAIIFSRGGYGSLRIISQLKLSEFITNYKWLVGFSDITVLLSMSSMLGIKNIHGPMVRSFAKYNTHKEEIDSLLEILKGDLPEYKIDGHHLNIEGEISAPLVGGNLSLLYSLRGTPYDLSTQGRILFFEDLNEYLYHLDRMLMNFKMGGKFNKIKGVIVGNLSGMKDGNQPFGATAEEIVHEHLSPFNIPVLFGFPAGHTGKNLPLIFGNNIKLSVRKNFGSVTFL